jgi:hypothetical protein
VRISKKKGNQGMFNFGNGKTLIDLIPDGLSHTATSSSSPSRSIDYGKSRRDRRVVVKRRKPLRQMRCSQMLNADPFRAKVIHSRTVTLDKLPGHNLW